MNKHSLLLISAFFLFMVSKAQTNVSGNITTNTTWTKANSPYVLVGNVGVPSAYTLTIEPGVTVQRDANYQMIVNGIVQVIGTQSDSIEFISTFQRFPNTPYFIEFQKSNLSKSNISFATFKAPNGITNNIQVGNDNGNVQTIPENSGTLYIINSNFSKGYTATNGYLTTASITIDSCVMDSGYILRDNEFSEPINISNTQLSNSSVNGGDNNPGVSFTNCHLTNNKLFTGSSGASLTLLNSTVENSQISSGDGPVTITNSTFINTTLVNIYGKALIMNSEFTITGQLYDINGFPTDYLFSIGHLILTNSEISNTSGNTFSGINLTGYNYDTSAKPDIINHNKFNNLYDAVIVNDFETIHVDSNNFYSPGRYDIVNYSTKDFSALYDYFQLNQGQTIDDLIYDQNDDLNYGLVTYTPYSSDSVLPVKLISFTGNMQEQFVQLNWQTASEINTAQFIIQHKIGDTFTDIGAIQPTHTNSGGTYQFTDASPVLGTNYYRLKIIDKDGRFAYSSVIPVVYNKKATTLSVYPNPGHSYIIVSHSTATQNAQLQLVTISGKVIKTIPVANSSVQTRIEVTGMAKGAYQIVWRNGTTTENKALLIQ